MQKLLHLKSVRARFLKWPLLLPLGPLREPINRLNSVDLIITNGVPFENNQYDMKFIPEDTHQLEHFTVFPVTKPEALHQTMDLRMLECVIHNVYPF